MNWIEKRHRTRWARTARHADTVDLVDLKQLRARARSLAVNVNRVVAVADARLQLPLAGQAAIKRPLHSDWAWRPEIWQMPVTPSGIASVASKTSFGEEAKVFHDCGLSELTVRQLRNTKAEDIAAFGLRMDVFRFDGSFLSLVVDLPPEGIDGLTRRHIMRLDVRMETEAPLEIFGRLNLRHGPNVEQIVREFEGSNGEQTVEFDVAASDLNEARLERAWIDLIFEGPEMNQITLRDMTMTRRPRADY